MPSYNVPATVVFQIYDADDPDEAAGVVRDVLGELGDRPWKNYVWFMDDDFSLAEPLPIPDDFELTDEERERVARLRARRELMKRRPGGRRIFDPADA